MLFVWIQIEVVKAIQDQGEASQDPATKCRSRSRSMASILSASGGIPPLVRRRSSSQTVDIPYADAEPDGTDNILDEIIEEQEEQQSRASAAKLTWTLARYLSHRPLSLELNSKPPLAQYRILLTCKS